MRCDEIMTWDVVSLRPMDRIDAAARRMGEENVGFAPVCDEEGRPVGAITDRDMALRVCAHDRRAGRTHVQDVMTHELLTCLTTDDVARAEALMADRHKNRIIVVDRRGRLAGVISLADIVEHDAQERAISTLRKVLEREVRGAAPEVPAA